MALILQAKLLFLWCQCPGVLPAKENPVPVRLCLRATRLDPAPFFLLANSYALRWKVVRIRKRRSLADRSRRLTPAWSRSQLLLGGVLQWRPLVWLGWRAWFAPWRWKFPLGAEFAQSQLSP